MSELSLLATFVFAHFLNNAMKEHSRIAFRGNCRHHDGQDAERRCKSLGQILVALRPRRRRCGGVGLGQTAVKNLFSERTHQCGAVETRGRKAKIPADFVSVVVVSGPSRGAMSMPRRRMLSKLVALQRARRTCRRRVGWLVKSAQVPMCGRDHQRNASHTS